MKRGTTQKNKEGGTHNTAIRMPVDVVRRLDRLAEITQPMANKCDLIRLCVANYLPEIEREFGIVGDSVDESVQRLNFVMQSTARLARKSGSVRTPGSKPA